MTISLDTATCRNFDAAVNLEWLCTNGLGGYASGTVSGASSRKYHGYLVVAARPPVDRYVMLSRVEDRIIVGPAPGLSYDLSTDEFPDVVHPQGFQNLISYEQGHGPVWRYQIGDSIVEKSITLVHGQDTVIVRYRLVGDKPPAKPIRLYLLPMFAGRDFHATIQSTQRPAWQCTTTEAGGAALLLGAPECPVKLGITHNADQFHSSPAWWYNFVFRQERQRGYPDRDDLWTPGTLEFSLVPGKSVGLICSTKPVPFATHESLIDAESRRYQKLLHSLEDKNAGDEFLGQLSAAADQFLVKRGVSGAGLTQTSVIAGYPWFEDWGRDTFISLTGLTLVTGQFAVAKSILVTYADHIRRGLLPNRFPDKSSTPEYHTVDAAMWFVHSAYQYWRYSGDSALLRDYLYRPLCEIMEKYRDGTDFGIRMDYDALIRAGEPHVQLTWMDAKVGDWVVTPRHGKPVEVNALWYSNLRIMSDLARAANDPQRAAGFADLAARAGISFQEKFWNAGGHCLYDVIDDEGKADASIRANQAIAVSVPFSPIPLHMQKDIIATMQRTLLTPMGMRTLAPGSLGYHSRCAGDQLARDMAYHQGTVWPWLIGPFISGYVKVNGNTADARAQAASFLAPFRAHLKQAGLGTISEIADADAPFTPRGTIAQAWSVAEVLRSYYEDVLDLAPAWPHEKAENLIEPAPAPRPKKARV